MFSGEFCDVPYPVSVLPSREYRSRFTNEETVSFCLRVMVGVIILYDHVHPVGAFAKTSKIDVSCSSDVKQCPCAEPVD